jgi:hypothetical protein
VSCSGSRDVEARSSVAVEVNEWPKILFRVHEVLGEET